MRSLLGGLRRSAALDAEMEEEFLLHLELRTADLVGSGMEARSAARRARLEFGSAARYREEGREQRGLRHLDELRSDVRHAARSLWKAPAFTLSAVLTLALGVGVNAAVFSMLSAALLRPLPFAEAERLMVLYQTRSAGGAEAWPTRWSHGEFAAVRSVVSTYTHLAAYYAADVNLSGASTEPVRVRAELVTASYLPALGMQPARGRGFLPHEDGEPGAHPVVVLGHDLWTRALGADPQVVGRRILLNGIPLEVVGVAPPRFGGLTGEAELWIPQAMAPSVWFPEFHTTTQQFLTVIGRLRPEATRAQAEAEAATAGAAAAAAARFEAGEVAGDVAWGVGLMPLPQVRRAATGVRTRLFLSGAALFVLLIAVVNLSGLLLARGTARRRESAVRAALGAGRLRLLRHGLAEGGVLGLLGGIAALLLAAWSVRVMTALAPERVVGGGPRFADVAAFADANIDWRVTAFALALACAAGLLAALLPAWRTTAGDLTGALRAGARGSAPGFGSLRRPTGLAFAAVAQVACALVLLVGAGLLLQALHRLSTVDPGFEPSGVITFRVAPPEREYGGAAAAPLLQSILERVESVAGVRSATVSLCPPFSGCSSTPLYIDGRPTTTPAPIVGRHYVAPAHFRTLGIPLLRGRGLTEDDRAGRPRVAVINETAARRFWPGEDPIGRRVWFGSGGGFASPDSLTEIVGIVGDVLYAAPGEEIRPDFYTSYLQFTWPVTTVMVRAAMDPGALVPALRRAVAAVDPNLALHDVRTMSERSTQALARERFLTAALSGFAGLGLLLVAVGIYGIMAFSVAQRRSEIGIRLALGATPRGILRFVVGQGIALTVIGLAIGAAASLVLGRALPALVRDAGSADPRVLAIVIAILLLVSLLACYLPGRSAARLNPVDTIGTD
jgi:predicted permease